MKYALEKNNTNYSYFYSKYALMVAFEQYETGKEIGWLYLCSKRNNPIKLTTESRYSKLAKIYEKHICTNIL